MKKTVLTLFSSALLTVSALAQDAEGCKDHSMFTRMPNYVIEECSENFNAVDFQMTAAAKLQKIEGNVKTIRYTFNSESGAKMPSPLQIVKNYENAIVKNGGKKVYSGTDDIDGGVLCGTFSMSKDGKEIWVAVRKMYEPQVSGEVGAFTLIILEKEAMKQDISASEMFEKIKSEGHIALYINFETGKSDIKSESMPIVDQIAQMMKSNASLKISVEGHTDNVGNAASNQTLSENRAKAVMNAISAKGIDKGRLSAKGWGSTKPVSDNNSENGKAKNRRVEIVKQ